MSVIPGLLTEQSLVVDSLKVAAITDYQFDFKATNPVDSGGFIELVFPTTQIQVPSEKPPS